MVYSMSKNFACLFSLLFTLHSSVPIRLVYVGWKSPIRFDSCLAEKTRLSNFHQVFLLLLLLLLLQSSLQQCVTHQKGRNSGSRSENGQSFSCVSVWLFCYCCCVSVFSVSRLCDDVFPIRIGKITSIQFSANNAIVAKLT